MLRILALLTIAILALELAEDRLATQKQQLSKLQPLIGAWRGVGQPQRGSAKESWIEQADWAWNFDNAEASLVSTQPKGKYFTHLKLSAGSSPGQFILSATPTADGTAVRYLGEIDDQQQLILNADHPRDDLPRRLSFRFVAAGDRLLLLLEKKAPTGGQLTRLAEIGYTRQGSGFGKNVAFRECIVTGGLGTIEVTHEGQTYQVCCTGCRDYFNENPKQVLAEYASRKAAEKAK
jgi:hypothetical protein